MSLIVMLSFYFKRVKLFLPMIIFFMRIIFICLFSKIKPTKMPYLSIMSQMYLNFHTLWSIHAIWLKEFLFLLLTPFPLHLIKHVLKKINNSQWVYPTFMIPEINERVRFISGFRQSNQEIKKNSQSLKKYQIYF